MENIGSSGFVLLALVGLEGDEEGLFNKCGGHFVRTIFLRTFIYSGHPGDLGPQFAAQSLGRDHLAIGAQFQDFHFDFAKIGGGKDLLLQR
jgi:hypothetical protein